MFIIIALGLAAVVLAHTAPAPFLLEAFRPSRSMWHMPPTRNPATVYLTYDDGPNPDATPLLLDVLKPHGAHATFFIIEKHVTDETAPILRRIVAEGHAIGLHSDTRALMIKSPTELAQILTAFATRVETLTGKPPCRLFRPHAGWRSGMMYAGLDRIGYRLVGWSWGLWDWNWFRAREADAIARRLLRKVSDGDIVVMHDGHHIDPRADRRYAIEATAKLVPGLAAKGFTFGKLCEP